MVKELLFRLITALTDAGFVLVAIVSDLAGENRGLWNELEISQLCSSFDYPGRPGEKIFVFADIPHQMTNIRNHLIDDGVQLPNGTVFGISELETMVAENGKELKPCPKLNSYLLEVKGTERMRVAPAVQLLSHHSRTLASKVFPNKPEISNFFETFNNGFDKLNSRGHLQVKNKYLRPYNGRVKEHNIALEKLEALVEEIRFLTKKKKVPKEALLPCQIGFLVSVKALKELWQYVHTMFGVKYILTSRLNTDALESFFSVIRSFNNMYTNPTPSAFRYRLRLVLLGCRLKLPRRSNVEFNQSDLFFLSSKLIEKNKLRPKFNLEPFKRPLTTQNVAHEDFTEMEKSSLRHLAGYVAWELKRKGKTVYGIPTSQIALDTEAPVIPDWIELLSKGGLLVPDSRILDWVMKCEHEFRGFSEYFQNCPGVTAILTEKIQAKFPHIDRDVVRVFLRTRIRIKIKALNNSRRDTRKRKRKSKQFHNSRKN